MLQRFATAMMCLISIGTLSAQTTDSTLPKGGKFKTIPFKKYNYAIQGYVANKEFVEGQEIIILSPIPAKNIHSDTLFFGKYFIQDNTAYIATPSAKIQLKNLTGISDCIYQISNHANGMSLTANPSIATPLTMTLYDMNFFKSKNIYKTVYIEKDTSNRYLCKIHFPSRQLSMIFDSLSCIYNMNDCIRHCPSVTLHYLSSKDTFTGYVKKKGDQITYAADSGEYRFATGEIFYGRVPDENKLAYFYFDNKIFVPTDGITQFSDGTTAKGDWLKNYNFNPTEWKYIDKHASNLTEIRDLAIEIQQLKEKYANFTEKEWNALYSRDHSITELRELASAIQNNKKRYAFIDHQWDMVYQHCSSVKEMQAWIDAIIKIHQEQWYDFSACDTLVENQWAIMKEHCKTWDELSRWRSNIQTYYRCPYGLKNGQWYILFQHCSNYEEFSEYGTALYDFNRNHLADESLHEEEWMALAHLPVKDIIEQAEEITAKRTKVYKRMAIIRKYGDYYGNLINQNQLATGMTTEMVNEIYPKELFNISIDGIYEYWKLKSSVNSGFFSFLFPTPDYPYELLFKNGNLISVNY